MQVRDDDRQGRPDDRLVECEQEQRQQDRAEDLELGAWIEMDGAVIRAGECRHAKVLPRDERSRKDLGRR